MKIVIISRLCYPASGPRANRTTELAKELVRQNNEVTIYALLGDYDYSEYSKKTGIRFKNLGQAKYGLSSNTGKKTNLFYKFLRKVFGKYTLFPETLFIPMVKKAIKNEKEIDVLITIAVPHILHMATALSDLSKIKTWIADCGDPFMGNPFHRPPFYFEYFERKWCEKCNYITVPVESAINAYYPEFYNKIKVIPQGFDFGSTKIASYHPNKVVTFAYSGAFYKGLRDPSAFLRYLTTIKIPYKFIIYTKDISLLLPYIKELGQNIEIREYIPREDLIYELSKMDFLVNIPNNSGVQQPSKLIDYALTKRPILEVSSEFTEDVKSRFMEFIAGDYHQQQVFANLEQYNIVNVAKHFLALV